MKDLGSYTLREAQKTCRNCNADCVDINTSVRCPFFDRSEDCKLAIISLRYDLKTAKEFTDDQLAVMRECYRCGFRFAVRSGHTEPTLNVCQIEPERENYGWFLKGEKIERLPVGMFPQIEQEDEEPIRFSDYIDIKKEIER